MSIKVTSKIWKIKLKDPHSIFYATRGYAYTVRFSMDNDVWVAYIKSDGKMGGFDLVETAKNNFKLIHSVAHNKEVIEHEIINYFASI